MRLIKLSANKPDFKTVKFNKTGISIILGKRHNDDYTQNKKGTYNSVGKSLIINLIHFCLGSQKNPEFESKLDTWEFFLDFEIGQETFKVARNCVNQGVVSLNEKEMTLKEYTDFLGTKVFAIPPESKFLTFRSLIPRFIRPQKSSYITYDSYLKNEQPSGELVNNAFLLGLDISLILKKQGLKDDLDRVEEMKKSVESDPVIKSFFSSDEDDYEIDVVDLKQKIGKLEKSISEFKVAEDYYQVVKEADQLKFELKSYENRASSYKTAIGNIEKSLQYTPDIPRKKIIDLYREAEIQLPDYVKKQLADVEEFNGKLLDNRSQRLIREKNDFEKKLRDVEAIIKNLGRQKDSKLEYLNTRGALDEFTKLNEQLKDLKIRYDSIEKFRLLKQEYKNKTEELKREFSLQNTATLDYLTRKRELIEKNIILFKELTDEFYEHKRAGIDIKSNEGINKTRFEIKAKIDDDKGDGVNDVKIFCFDWTILKAQHNHNVKLLFHDSRLLSEIDSRQQATLMKVAYDNTAESDLQYVISINQTTYDSLKAEMQVDEFNDIIEDNIILELTDESDKSKLLGIQVDLDYDKE
ncbi:DUF2326 domain-containing protein [Pedobacter sandarakinus]|uniref:DUF2326 domain-containing protein n=1 Tax=Pedobacter sandarakinus TaxID=353156 RepID=UPI002247C558|nr:DUF2326 domain-containing protein [Pedobacter sandarakinus]MCX2575701.1 DUF2326 domain-containing protein [Pedobacter sandarakinus]